MGDHERDHAYRIVNGLQNRKLKGHWHDMDMTALILAAQKHKLGNWFVLFSRLCRKCGKFKE